MALLHGRPADQRPALRQTNENAELFWIDKIFQASHLKQGDFDEGDEGCVVLLHGWLAAQRPLLVKITQTPNFR